MTITSGSTTEAASSAAQRLNADRDIWREILSDVAVVTVTPFTGERLEAVDHEGLARNLDHVLGAGVRLLVAGGNTGEFAALSVRELIETFRTHVHVGRGRARVIAGIGYRLGRAIKLGRSAIEVGVDALMVHHPIHPYASEDGLLAYYRALAGALPGVPLIPYVRGPQLTTSGARELAEIDTVVGAKMGLPEPKRFARYVSAAPQLAWVNGVAEAWAVPFAGAGAVGYTSGLANIAPGPSLELLVTLRAAEFRRAEALVESLSGLEELRGRRGGANSVAALKAALELVGLTGGGLRPPLSALRPAEHAELVGILKRMGLLR